MVLDRFWSTNTITGFMKDEGGAFRSWIQEGFARLDAAHDGAIFYEEMLKEVLMIECEVLQIKMASLLFLFFD